MNKKKGEKEKKVMTRERDRDIQGTANEATVEAQERATVSYSQGSQAEEDGCVCGVWCSNEVRALFTTRC
jgi:hypothetical protein